MFIDFESPVYDVNTTIDGQDGWTATGGMVRVNNDLGGGTWVLDFSDNVGISDTASRNLRVIFDSGKFYLTSKIKWTFDKIGAFNLLSSDDNTFLTFGIDKNYLQSGLYWYVQGGTGGAVTNANVPGTDSGVRFIEILIEVDIDANIANISWGEVGGPKTSLFTNYVISADNFSSFNFKNSKVASMVDDIKIWDGRTCQERLNDGDLIGDINSDCYVDFLDLAILSSYWLMCNEPHNAECDLFSYQAPEYRLFVTKVYPGHDILSNADFRQLADAGFTTVVKRWQLEDVPSYVQGAAAAGLNAMTWEFGNVDADLLNEIHTVTSVGNETKYAVPYSVGAWNAITQTIVERATLSMSYPNFKGVTFDFEIYDSNKINGFAESYDVNSFVDFLISKDLPIPSPLTNPTFRRTYLLNLGLLNDFITYQYDLVAEQVVQLRQAVDEINPNFQFGVYGWGPLVEAVKENLATELAPVLDMDARTYGRTLYPYQTDTPDRPALKWSLLTNSQYAKESQRRGYPVVFLGGHDPHVVGDGDKYKYTVRQAFNSTVYNNGYWIWTEWSVPDGWEKQDWIDALMVYFKESKSALDSKDWTWASRQQDQVANPEATNPMIILTRDASGSVKAWDPITGVEMDSYPVPKSYWGAIDVGDVDAIVGNERVYLKKGWIEIFDGEGEILLLKFFVGADQVRLQLIGEVF